MSPKLSNRLSSKKKKIKLPVDNGPTEVLFKLGLGASWTSPLERATMLDISTWSLEKQAPIVPEHLPHAFLQHLWLLSPDARSPCCQPPDALTANPGEEMDYELGQDSQSAVNPLDLVTAVYMSANSFLQQEMTVRMLQCQFAVPLVLPAIIPEQSCFLLWPLRGVVSQWRPHSLVKTRRVLEGDLASTEMPMVSCVKLGRFGVSKSRVLNHVIGGPRSHNECFLHRGMDGGQLHRKLSNGLVELGWSLPSGDPDRDVFPVPVVISNLRGDAAAHERCLSLLCRASSAVVVFCGNLREKEKLLLASWKVMASKLILIDLSDPVEEENERRVVGFVPQNLQEEMGLPNGAVLSGGALSEEELADRLGKTLNDLLPDRLRYVTLEAAADIAVEVGMCVDEGAVCKKAMAAVEEVLKGLEDGSAQFREKQLPLQGALWSRLAELDKEESKQIKAGEGVNIQLQLEKRRIIHDQSSYRMTTAMKVFTDALFTTNKMERAFFLSWMKLSLRARQMRQCTLQKPTHDQQEESGGLSQETGGVTHGIDDRPEDVPYGANYDLDDDDSFCTCSTVEGEEWGLHQYEPQPLATHHGEKSGLQFSFSKQEPAQELNLEPVVELHMAGDPTENDGLELSCPEGQSEKGKLDLDQADPMQVDLDPGNAAEKIMEEVSSERKVNENGTQSLNTDPTEKITDEWELSYSEGQNKKQEREPNLGQTNQIEKGQLDPVHADAEQMVLELKESAEQNMEPVLAEEEVIEPRPEPLNMDYTENSGLHFDISEQQSEQQLNLEPVVELHMAGDPPEKDVLESSYSEEQPENQELETNMDQTDQFEKEQLDPVHTDAEQVYLDLEDSTEQSLEEGTIEKAATENGTQTLNMDNTANSVLNFDLSEQQSEQGLNLEPIMEPHMAGDPTVNDEQELSYSEEQTRKQNLETNMDQFEEIEKGQQDPAHAVQEQVDLDIEESAEQNMEPGVAEEEIIKPGPEPLNMEVTENSALKVDLSEQQSELGLKLEHVVELHMAGDLPENDWLESSYSEEEMEKQELETNLDQTNQIVKGQLDPVYSVAKQVDFDLKESTEQTMEPGLAEEEVIEPGPEPLNIDHNECSEQHFNLSEKQSEQGMKLESIVEQHITTADPSVKDDLESKCAEEQNEKQQLDPNIDPIDQTEKEQLDPVLDDAEQVDLDLEESAEKVTDPELAEKEFVEPQPFNMDHAENSGSEQKCEQKLNLETVLELHVAGDLTENTGLETSYSEEQTEKQELELNTDQIDQTEKEQPDSVHADAERDNLDHKESTEQNMEEGTTKKVAIENGIQTLSMDYTDNSGLHFDHSEQQSEQGLKLEPIMELHMAGDPTVNDEQESIYSEEQTEKQNLEAIINQIEKTEKEQLNPVLADEEPMNLDLEESAEHNTEPELTEKEVIEPGPQLLNMDHAENSGLHFYLSEQQSEQALNLDPVEEMHIAGNSTLNDYGQELKISEKQTKKQELESNMDQIDQSKKGQFDDAEKVDLNLSDEEYAEQKMGKGSAEKEVIENGQLDSFHTDEEQVDLDLKESAEHIMEPELAEKDVIEPGPEPLNMEVTENNRLHFDISEQQSRSEAIEEMHNAGNFTLNACGQELNSSEKQEVESNMDQIDQSEKGHLDPVLPDAEQVDLDLSDETYAEQNMPEKETFKFGFYETLNEEQNLELKNPENEPTDMKPGSREQKELKPALEEQMDLEPTEKENMGLEPIEIVQHAEIDQSENRDFLEEQTIDTEISENQSLHLESGTTQIFDLNLPEEQSEEQKIKPDQPPSNPTAENHLDINTSLEDLVELDPIVEHYFEPDPSSLGLEHFLREMGLIFELTHMSLGSGSHNVLRLPSLAADLLLYGVPLELMDGDASNIPSCWLGCVLAELKRRLPPIGIKVRVLTNLGVHCAKNAEVFTALFGVDFPRGRRRPTRGVYMLPLWLPDDLRMDMDCDFLIMVDVEGLCSPGLDQKGDTQVHDNEMATIATGLSDVLMHNIISYGDAEIESNLTVIVNALLRTEVCGYTPICELLTQDKGLNAKFQAFQLGCVAGILQTEIEATENTDKPLVKAKSSIPCLIGPWQNTSLSEPVDKEYSKTVIELKQNLFEALTKCATKSEATGLPEFMGRLFAVWEAVKAESFSIGLQNTEVAKAFSMLCMELSNWEKMLLEHMESWFVGATKRVIFNNAKALETGVTWDLLSVLKQEARVEVKTEVDQIRSKLEAYLMKDNLHKTNIVTYRPNLMSNMNKLQDQVTDEMIERLETARENHNSSLRLKSFQTLLEKEQEAKLHTLTETSKLSNISLEDMQLEEEFEGVWNNALSNYDFRLTEIDDIAARVTIILRENLISRGLQKQMKKLEDIGKNNTSGFIVHDEHFEFHSRLKHIKRQQWLQAHYVANYIIEEYNQFVVGKSNLVADVSDSYITKVLENVEEILKANPLEITSTFEVDLKVYLCGFACQDLQDIHDRYTKDSFLAYIKGAKNSDLGRFIYQVRKRDQCQRVAQAFTSMVFKPTALDYIYRPLGKRIMEEMISRDDAQQYLSPQAFNRSLLEELMEEDSFESYLEYLLSYESFSLGRIQRRVVAHLSETTILEEWRQQRLEEIVGKINAAVSQKEEDVSGVLSDTKLLLEKVCLNLEKDGDVDVSWDFLDGPLFSITTEWDVFVTCLLEALAEMQRALAQEFSQIIDITQLLHALPIKPQVCLFNRVKGCEKKCPFCRAPCEVGEIDHKVHRALLHRPKGMLSYTCHDSCSLSHTSCPFDIAHDNLFLNKETEGQSLAYKDYHSLYPDWSISSEEPDSQTPNAYWRYVLVRFNGRFAGEYTCEPAQLPEEWENITQEEALESLNQAFHTEHF